MSLLEDVGKALWGGSWQTPLAEALGVKDRTVRRWHSGETVMPERVWNDIHGIAVKRRQECGAAADAIKAHIKGTST